MSITRDQVSTIFATGSASSGATSFGTNPPAGDKVLIGIWAFGSGGVADPTSVVDNGTSATTFTKEATRNDTTNGLTVWIYRGDNVSMPGSGAYKVTVTYAAAHEFCCGAVAYGGVSSGTALATNSNAGTSATPSSGAAGSGNGNLYFAVMNDAGGTTTEGITTTSPFVQQVVENNGNSFEAGVASDQINANGSQSCSWSIGSGSQTFVACIAVWTPAATVSPPPFPARRDRWRPAQVWAALR